MEQVLQIGARAFTKWAGYLLQCGSIVIAKWGRYCSLGQIYCKIGATITEEPRTSS